VRGALVLARKGLSRLTWYFYANTVQTLQSWDAAKSLFARSGLTSSSAANFQNKLSLYALRLMVGTLGTNHFYSVIQETDDAYVYLLSNDQQAVTHVVAWRPIDADDSSSASVSFPLVGRNAVSAWKLGVATYTSAALPVVNTNTGIWTMTITSLPTVVALDTPVSFVECQGCVTSCLTAGCQLYNFTMSILHSLT